MSSLDLNYAIFLEQLSKNSTDHKSTTDLAWISDEIAVKWSPISTGASTIIFSVLSAYLVFLILLTLGCGWLVYSTKKSMELDIEKADKKAFIFADFTEKCDQACLQIV